MVFESLWVLSPLVWELLSSTRVLPGVPDWLVGDQSLRFGVGPLCLAELCERGVARRSSWAG